MKKRYWAILLAVLLVGHFAYFAYYHGVWMSWSVDHQFNDEGRLGGEYAGTDDHFLIVVTAPSREHNPREILYEYHNGTIQPVLGLGAGAVGDFSHIRYFPQVKRFVYLRTDWWNQTTEINVLYSHETLSSSVGVAGVLSKYPSQSVAAYDPASGVLFALNQEEKYYPVGHSSGADYVESEDYPLGLTHLPNPETLDYGGSHQPDVRADGLSLYLKDVKIKNLFWDMIKLNIYQYAYMVLWKYFIFVFQLAVTVLIIELIRRTKIFSRYR